MKKYNSNNFLGRIAIHKNDKMKYIFPNELEEYSKDGWQKGVSEQYRAKRRKLIEDGINQPGGRANTIEKENIRRMKISQKMKGNRNWEHNKRHGNSKHGWYHGIYCDSTWELAFLVYHIENNLTIKRSEFRLPFVWQGEIHTYIPDFNVDEDTIEIKGRKTKKSLEKEKQYPNIKVIDKHSIQPYLNYVISKYGNRFWEILYEDVNTNNNRKHTKHKKFTKVCRCCGVEFNTNSITQKYCSHDCYEKTLKKHDISSEILINDFINIKSFSDIGRKYSVSDKAVAKWFKMLGLPHKKQELANYINNFN